MEPTHPSTEIRYLASTLTLVSGYYAIRASLQLPRFREMFVGMESDMPRTLNTMILIHPHWYLAVVVVTLLATLAIIWTNLRSRQRIYPLGILLLFLFAERAVMAAFDPIFRMVTDMGSQ